MKKIILALVLTLPTNTIAAERSYMAKKRFKLANPCPATGKTHGKCPGYVMDHIKPLCAGGSDTPHNLQWQTKAESYKKDKLERALCRTLKQPSK